jgi:serine/threonine protein kinase
VNSDKAENNSLALKIIYKRNFNDGCRTSLLYSELSVLRRLKHRNLLELIDEQDTPDKLYLILPLITVS